MRNSFILSTADEARERHLLIFKVDPSVRGQIDPSVLGQIGQLPEFVFYCGAITRYTINQRIGRFQPLHFTIIIIVTIAIIIFILLLLFDIVNISSHPKCGLAKLLLLLVLPPSLLLPSILLFLFCTWLARFLI